MSETATPSRSYIIAWRLNGVVWSILLFLTLALAVTWGNIEALLPLMGILAITGLGMLVNGAFLLWSVFAGHLR
jgi:predicted membrane-bound mannosyltransferase